MDGGDILTVFGFIIVAIGGWLLRRSHRDELEKLRRQDRSRREFLQLLLRSQRELFERRQILESSRLAINQDSIIRWRENSWAEFDAHYHSYWDLFFEDEAESATVLDLFVEDATVWLRSAAGPVTPLQINKILWKASEAVQSWSPHDFPTAAHSAAYKVVSDAHYLIEGIVFGVERVSFEVLMEQMYGDGAYPWRGPFATRLPEHLYSSEEIANQAGQKGVQEKRRREME